MTEKTYTPNQLGELLHRPAKDITSMWVKGQFPGAFLDDKKTLQIPEVDALPYLSNVANLDKSAVSTPATATPVPEEITPPKTDKPADTITSPVTNESYERTARLEVDLYVQKRRDEADAYYDDKIKQADEEAELIMGKADSYGNQRRAIADAEYDALSNEILGKQETLRKLKVQFDRLYQAAQANRSYAYQLAMSDSWGRFLAEVKRLIGAK